MLTIPFCSIRILTSMATIGTTSPIKWIVMMAGQLSQPLTPLVGSLFMTKMCTLTPLQSYCRILTSRPQRTDHCLFRANLHRYVYNTITDTDSHVAT
jgi:hypothetical protein